MIPEVIEAEATGDVRNHVWTLEQLKRVAEVSVVDNKLVINSDNVHYENGNLYVTLTEEQIIGCDEVDEKTELEQQCALATIFQKGLDPLDINDGIRWSEAVLEEISALQLIQDIIEAVANVSSSVQVLFDTVEDDNGNSFLSYKIVEAT